METLRIGIVATATFPLPPPTHTGDIVILDLARSLDELGHEVTLVAPEGTAKPGGGRVLAMPASYGYSEPSQTECEQRAFQTHQDAFLRADVVHDFSTMKGIAEALYAHGRTNVVSTLLGGVWTHPTPPYNLIVWSEAMRGRGLRGASDYEGTRFTEWDSPGPPIKDAHVVPGGVDTDFYSRGDVEKEEWFLWMNRWHPAKGPDVAIELARRTGIPLVMAGEHPDNERFDYQRQYAIQMEDLAANLPNVRFEWLPPDPDHHTAKRDLYRRAKALIYSIRFQEPFGLAQVEALACGTPVIGLRFGSVPEIINGGRYKTGFVCGDLPELALATLQVDKIRSADCRMDAQERFDRRVMAANYLKEYRLAMDGKVWGL